LYILKKAITTPEKKVSA